MAPTPTCSTRSCSLMSWKSRQYDVPSTSTKFLPEHSLSLLGQLSSLGKALRCSRSAKMENWCLHFAHCILRSYSSSFTWPVRTTVPC